MGIPVMIMGESGSGKTYSIKNLNPDGVLVLLCEKNRLPFKKKFETFKIQETLVKGKPLNHGELVHAILGRMEKKICVIDDSQYLMVNEYFDRMQESGYQKYTEIGSHFRDVIHSVNNELPDDVIVYFLHHTDQDASSGRTKAKTIGRLLDDKLTLEGCFDIVLRTCVTDRQYTFRTRTDGSDTAKSPEEMFETPTIPNDLALVDATIRAYYGLQPLQPADEPKPGKAPKPNEKNKEENRK